MNKKERIEYQRLYRKKNGNLCTRKYEKTPSGFLMRLYRNMTSRVTGIQKKKAHLYVGKTILPREEFYRWADSKQFKELFKNWEASKYDRKLTPTVNRIDSSLGYQLDNIEWLTHSENSRLGALSKMKI